MESGVGLQESAGDPQAKDPTATTPEVPKANDVLDEQEAPAATNAAPSISPPNNTEDPISTAQQHESLEITEDTADAEGGDFRSSSLARTYT